MYTSRYNLGEIASPTDTVVAQLMSLRASIHSFEALKFHTSLAESTGSLS